MINDTSAGEETSRDLLVVLPTYNERESLPVLVEEISRHCPTARIMVVDDNSPDGTGDLAEDLKGCYPLEILHRKAKTGLADAYREVLGCVLRLGPDYVVTMDADLSHNPCYLPEIIRCLGMYDVVVGSRYVQGGGVVNWPIRRLILSQFGNWYARTATGLHMRDCTSGFIGFRRRVLETLPFRESRSRGYAFLVELKFLSNLAGFSMAEVPILFHERAGGCSKMTLAIALEAFWRVPSLRFSARRCRRLMNRS